MAALGQDDTVKETLWKINETLRELSGVNKLCQRVKEDQIILPPADGDGFPNFLLTTEGGNGGPWRWGHQHAGGCEILDLRECH